MKVLMVGNRLNDTVKGGMVSCAQLLIKNKENIDYFWSWSGEKYFGNISFLWRAIRIKRDYDVYHLHTAAKVDFVRNIILIFFLKRRNNRVILHIHGSGFSSSPNINPIHKYILKRVDGFIVLSHSWRILLSKAWKIRKEMFFTLPNPIESRHFKPLTISQERRLKVCFIGELSERKGVMNLLKAIPRSSRSFEFFIAGAGPLRENALTEIRRLNGLGYAVNFCGFIQSEVRNELLDSCDIMVLPSKAENLPISIIEAMHSSCAIVATDVGAVSSLVDSKNGVLIENGDPVLISRALKCILESDLKSLKKVSFERSLSYLENKVNDELEDIYVSIV